MKTLILSILLQVSLALQASAAIKIKGQYLFALDQKTGPVREISIKVEDSEDMNVLVAKIRAKLQNGTQVEGEFVCEMGKAQHLNCRRDDDGGEFTLIMDKKNPQLQFESFDLADEGDENSIPVTSADGHADFTVSGKAL